ncbi:MAG: hypothetical protein DMG08_11275 [Acidobacteria bacterium]|nr:MAG: hypothetical protein DMG08_11275 [Acidobacteriota bacterium]
MQPHEMEWPREHLGNYGNLVRALKPTDDAEPAALAFDPHVREENEPLLASRRSISAWASSAGGAGKPGMVSL